MAGPTDHSMHQRDADATGLLFKGDGFSEQHLAVGLADAEGGDLAGENPGQIHGGVSGGRIWGTEIGGGKCVTLDGGLMRGEADDVALLPGKPGMRA